MNKENIMKNFLYITTLVSVLAIKETSSKYRKADIVWHGTTTPHTLSHRHFGRKHHHDRHEKISGRKYNMKREPMSSYELRKLLKKQLLPYSKTASKEQYRTDSTPLIRHMDLEKSYSSSNERSKSTEKHWSTDSKENYNKDCFICPKNMKKTKRNSNENDNDMETHERKKEKRKHHKKSYLRMKEEENSMETDWRPKMKNHGKLSLECRKKKQNYKSLCQGEVESNIESDGRQKTEGHSYVDYDEHLKIKKVRNEKSLLRQKEQESSKDSDSQTIKENSEKKSLSRQKKKESENIESDGRQKRKDKGKKKSVLRQKTEENISVESDERKAKKNSNTKKKYSKINHSNIKIDLESEISKEANKISFMSSSSSPKPTEVDESNDSDDANTKESIKDADDKTKKTSSSSNEDSQQFTVTTTKETKPTSSKVKKSTTKKSTKETTVPKRLENKSEDKKHRTTREKVSTNKRFSVVVKKKNIDSSKAEDTQNFTAIKVDSSTDSEENQNFTVIKVVSSKKSEGNHNSTEIIVDSSIDSKDNQNSTEIIVDSSKDTDDNQNFDSSKDSEGYQNISVIEVVMATKTKETETLTTRVSRKFGRIKIKKAKKSTAKSDLEKAFSKVEKYMRKIIRVTKVTKLDKADKPPKRKSRPYKLKSNLENQLYIIVTSTEKIESINNYQKLVPILPSDVIHHKKHKISPENYGDRMASPMPISSNQKRFVTKNANNADSNPTTAVKVVIPNQEHNTTKDSLEKENEKFDLRKLIKTLSEKEVMENITNALFQNMLKKYKNGNKKHKINPNIARNLPHTEKIPALISDEGTFEQFEIYLGNDINMERDAELLRRKVLNAAKGTETTKKGNVKKLILVEKT